MNQQYFQRHLQPATTATVIAQDKASSAQAFADAIAKAGVAPAEKPNPSYVATGGVQTIFKHGQWNKVKDLALYFIHETFHLDVPYGFYDSAIARALGASFKTDPKSAQKTEENASLAWNAILEKMCGARKPK
jgi:hypothetical protein